jgi:AraC family transcriptional regulator
MATSERIDKNNRVYRELALGEVRVYSRSPWGYWDGIQLIHTAHELREFEMKASTHRLIVFRARSTRYSMKQGKQEHGIMLNPDTVSFILAGSTFQMKCGDTTQEDIEIKISPEFLESVALEMGVDFQKTPIEACLARNDARTAEVLKILLEDFESGSPFGVEFGNTLIRMLMQHVIRTYTVGAVKPTQHVGPMSPRALRELENFVSANLGRNPSLKDVADIVGYSPFHLHRVFKASTGITLYEYISSIRLEKAREMLLLTDMSIVNIAMETGFSDQSHLARQLRRKYGLSPTEIRANKSQSQD